VGLERGPLSLVSAIEELLVRKVVQHSTFPSYVRFLVRVSQSYITTDGQPVSMSWCRAQSGTFDRRFFFIAKLLSCLFFGAPCLTRGRVCHLSVFVNRVYSDQSVFT
jgi:hypothetical protein